MSRGGAISSRRYSYPSIKQECRESVDSAQIMNLTSIFSSPTYRSAQTLTQIKEENTHWNCVSQSQGLTPSGHSYRPLVEKSVTGRTQVGWVCVNICKQSPGTLHGWVTFEDFDLEWPVMWWNTTLCPSKCCFVSIYLSQFWPSPWLVNWVKYWPLLNIVLLDHEAFHINYNL